MAGGGPEVPERPIERAVCADLQARGVSVETDGMAALAVSLARQLDGEGNSRSRAELARELRAALLEVAAAHPIESTERDEIDDLRARRQARRGA